MTHWERSDATEVIPSVPAPDAGTEADPGTPAEVPPEREHVTCPECGTVATVTLNRRQAEDFCRHCDYPLFWTPSLVVLDSGGLGADSLRRMPGTTGRAMTASLACPHCAEPNPVTAETCLRCGLPMHVPVAVAPSPAAPVYVPPPPSPEPVPERTPWWVWFLLALAVVAAVTVGVLYWTGVIG